MSKDIDLKKINQSFSRIFSTLKRYAGFGFFVTVLLVYSFLVFRISVLSDPKPDDADVAEQMNTVKRLKIDQNAISKIQQLEDQNVGVQSLFEEARDNPFQD